MLNFIANYSSGSGATKKAVNKLRAHCEKNNIEHKFYFTEYAKHATTLVTEIEASGQTDIIILGGDGTFHEALNGVKNTDKTILGLIPTGSGNDFAKTAKLPKNQPLKILSRILSNHTRQIDYLQFSNGLRCLNVCGMGLDSEVLIKAKAIRWLFGKPNYFMALLRTLKKFDPYELTIECEGKTYTEKCIMVGITNGRYFGGSMNLSPFSEIDDGKMEVIIIKDVERKKIKYILPGFLSGAHVKKHKYYCIPLSSSSTVKITPAFNYKSELDGEIYPDLNFEVSIVPKGLKIFY